MGLPEVCRKHAEECEARAQTATPLHCAQLHKSAHIWRLLADALAENEMAVRQLPEPNGSASLSSGSRQAT